MTTFQYLMAADHVPADAVYCVNAIAWTVIYLAPIAPGLITKAVFRFADRDATLEVRRMGIDRTVDRCSARRAFC